MSTMLPKEWINTNLGSILLSIIGGGTPSKSKPEYFLGNIPWMSVKDMNKHILKDTVDHITPDAVKNSSTNIIPAGTPIIATRMSLGKIVTAPFDSAINQDLKALLLPKGVERNFFLHWYRSQSQLIESLGTGTTVKGIRLEVLNGLSINLPPLSEQKIIANKLDDLLARVESIKTRLENIPEILKKFRQSVLSAAVSGRLNSKHCPMKSIHVGYGWPHDVEGPSHWVEYKLSDIIKIVGGSQPPKSDFRDVCVDGYIRLIQIRDYKSDNHKVFIPRDKAKRFVYKDDVMIGRYGPPIFQILRGLEGAYNVALMKAVPNEEVIRNDYLYWYLQNFNIFNYVESGSDRTAGQSGVNKKHLESYPMLIPSLTEQDEIIKSLEIFFSYAKSIELKAIDALNKVNNLTQSILAKAFRGELTAQWREENFELISGLNSAEALLEKITAEKLAAGTVKKRAKKTSH